MVLLQTILVLIIVYYALKFILKWAMPRLLNYAIKKTGERFGGHPGYQNQAEQAGDTTVFKNPQQKSNPSKKVGEYIDFEEIE